jgi:hypothetical protein
MERHKLKTDIFLQKVSHTNQLSIDDNNFFFLSSTVLKKQQYDKFSE